MSTKTGWFHLVDGLDLVDILAVTDHKSTKSGHHFKGSNVLYLHLTLKKVGFVVVRGPTALLPT